MSDDLIKTMREQAARSRRLLAAGKDKMPSKEIQCAVWVWLWSDGTKSLHDVMPPRHYLSKSSTFDDHYVVGSTLISGVIVREGEWGNPDPGMHQDGAGPTPGLLAIVKAADDLAWRVKEQTERFVGLCDEVNHVITQCDGATAWIADLLLDALYTASGETPGGSGMATPDE